MPKNDPTPEEAGVQASAETASPPPDKPDPTAVTFTKTIVVDGKPVEVARLGLTFMDHRDLSVDLPYTTSDPAEQEALHAAGCIERR